MRSFVVAAREKSTEVRNDPVEARTAEHAIAQIATAGSSFLAGTVFEAWPTDQPTQVVKFTI
jgi:hypothetical protein